jgi:hypothetical protein
VFDGVLRAFAGWGEGGGKIIGLKGGEIMDEKKMTRRDVLKLGGAMLGAAAAGEIFSGHASAAPRKNEHQGWLVPTFAS